MPYRLEQTLSTLANPLTVIGAFLGVFAAVLALRPVKKSPEASVESDAESAMRDAVGEPSPPQ